MTPEHLPSNFRGNGPLQGSNQAQEADPAHLSSDLSFRSGLEEMLPHVKRRFSELAEDAVKECGIPPERARAVLNSLALSFDRTVREASLVLQRQFAGDVEAALGWGAGKLIETCRHIAAGGGDLKSGLQSLALLQVQVLEAMLPQLLPQQPGTDPLSGTLPAALLKSSCALLNNGLEASQQAEACYSEGPGGNYLKYRITSQLALLEAARTLRRMSHSAGPGLNDLRIGLYGFQLELAAQSGSLRSFLRAVSNLAAASKLTQYRGQAVQPHCLLGDLLPTLFHRHFEFTIDSPGDAPALKQEELISASHKLMWRKAEPAISRLLQEPEGLSAAAFKSAVHTELLRAIEEITPRLAEKRVKINITSSDFRAVSRGKSYQYQF